MRRLFLVWMMALIALPAAAAARHHPTASSSIAMSVSGPLGLRDVEAILSRVLTSHAKDAFDPGPRFESLAGRPVRITLPVLRCSPENDSTNPAAHSGCWQYHPDEQNLHLDAWKLSALAPFEDKTTERPWAIEGLSLGGLNRRVGGYVGQNAFGASRAVDVYRSVHFGIGAVGPHEALDGLQPTVDNVWTFSKDLTLPADEARKATTGLEIVIEGVVNVTPQLGAAFCEDASHDPTLAVPEEREGKLCVLSVRIDRVAFVSPNGGTLAEWIRTNSAAPGSAQ